MALNAVGSSSGLDLTAAFREMLRIRRFEEECLALREADEVAGSLHPCCGQEAIPVGALACLEDGDRVLATYRGHGWAIACGVPLEALLAEVCGRSSGVNRGRGGSAYLSAPSYGFVGENSIVGAGIPVAGGLALAAQLRGESRVALVSFGDGATSQGAVHEGIVFAAARSLPLVLVCENNGWSEMTPITAIARVENLAERAAGYGIPGVTVDGDDPATVAGAVGEAVARARAGEGPTFVECRTHRLLGHYNADIEHYRPDADRDEAAEADPVERLRTQLIELGEVSEAELGRLEQEVAAELEAARGEALRAPTPDPASARDHVVAQAAWSPPSDEGKSVELTYGQAVNAALDRELRERPEALVFGEDIAIPGGVFGCTRKLLDTYGPERVFDTPIAESAILGAAIGSATEGFRPIVEIMWADFLLVALDQLVNQAANVRYLHSGEANAPLVVRCQQGVTPGSCAQHSQSLEALLAHIPGLKVGMPSTGQDAYAMLRAAVEDPDPCVLIESRAIYGWKGPVELEGPREQVGGSRIRRAGSDLGIVTWGRMSATVLEAADALEREGVSTGVLDLRWLTPLDNDAIAELVRATSRVLIVHEANLTGGFGAEVAARITERHFDELDAPVTRVGAPDIRFPSAPVLQDALLPSAESIAKAAGVLVSG